MILTRSDAIQWTATITALAVFFQTLELLALRKTAHDQGIWRWEVVRRDFSFLPSPLRALIHALLCYQGFLLILVLRLVCAFFIAFTLNPVAIGLAFVTTLLISLRWRGSFNGGSDFMNLIVLSALFVAACFKDSPAISTACLWYIAIQTCTSYFIAGMIKLKRENWRTGRALSGFLSTTIYHPDRLSSAIAGNPTLSMLASWSVMLFECAFPVALLNPQLCLAMMSLALLFHLANFYLLGLNRFLLSWAAAYPALFFCAISRSQ